MRNGFIAVAVVFLVFSGLLVYMRLSIGYWLILLSAPIIYMGLVDYFQTTQTIKRNFPVLGRFRYLFELIRPEINQYFIESNKDGRPFSREERSLVYQRAKKEVDTLPFGTQNDVYAMGYEWLNHSLSPKYVDPLKLRKTVGGDHCKKPYSASLLNISAMSYGALGKTAIEALNAGAKDGDFAHNTGEGGISPHHRKHGGDLIWQIGTGYFGCREYDGRFNPSLFAENASSDQVKMIELKLSQGAKPAHGGILPGDKVSKEIASIRNVPIGKTVYSPPAHSEFDTPVGLLHFIAKLRELSGGKPVGFKLSIGRRREFFAICKAMMQEKIYPDYIAIDGGEGGTGAAPLEFSNNLGMPSYDALTFVHNALTGCDLRDKTLLMASGKVISAFQVIKLLAIGADLVYSARAMMLALGCIQALRCNTNHCPAGVATTDPSLTAGLVVSNKRQRVTNFHRETIDGVAELIGAMGLRSDLELRPWHIFRRTSREEIKNYAEIFPIIAQGSLLSQPVRSIYSRAFENASADTFEYQGPI